MPLEEKTEKWLVKLAAAANLSVEFEKKQSGKQAAVNGARAAVEKAKADLKTGMRFTVLQDGKVVPSVGDDTEQIDEIETEEVGKMTAGPSINELKKAGEARRSLVEIEKKMTKELQDAGLDEAEIAKVITEELYTPLVREKVIPDNLVPGKFSATQQMLDATNKLYVDSLEGLDVEDASTRAFALAKKGVGVAANVAKEVANCVGIDKSMADGAKMAGNIIAIAELTVTTGLTAAEAISKNDLRGSAEDIAANIGKILTACISIHDPSLGAAVGGAYTAATSLALIVKDLTDSPPNYNAALKHFADGIEGAFKTGTASMDKGKQKDDIDTIGKLIADTLRAGANATVIKKAIEDRDFAGLVTGVTALAKAAVATGIAAKGGFENAGKSDEEKKKAAENSKDLQEKIDAALDTGKLALLTGAAVYTAAKQGEISGALETVVANVGEALSGLMTAFVSPDAGKAAAAAYKATTSAGLCANYAIKGQPDKAIQVLGDGFASALELAAPKGDKTFAIVGAAMAAAFKAGVKGAEIKKALDDGDVDSVIDLLTDMGKDVVDSSTDIKTAATGKDPTSGETDVTDSVKEGVGAAGELAKAIAELKKLKDDPEKAKEIEKNLKEKVAEVQGQEAEEEIARDQKEFDRILAQVDEGGAEAADTRSVEILIKQMQRDRLIMELALKIGGAGLDVAAKFVPGLSVAGAALKLTQSLMAAANRAMALNKWMDNQKDGKAAASVYSTSISNFVQNQAEQFSYYSIKAALQLAQLIGNALELGGITAAAGTAISKVSVAIEVAVDVGKEIYDEAMLERAWNTTKLALANKNNRKLGLIARSQNPTLAKYSIAWGAVEKKDAIAKSAMASCGLNAATLAQKDANVSNVVKYLETMFPDDRQVKKGLAKPQEWEPAEISLTAKCFASGRLAAEKIGGLAKTDAGAIDGTFVFVSEVEIKYAAAKKGKAGVPEAAAAYEDGLTKLAAQLTSYKPVKADVPGAEHTEMKEFAEKFVDLIKVEKMLLEQALVESTSA